MQYNCRRCTQIEKTVVRFLFRAVSVWAVGAHSMRMLAVSYGWFLGNKGVDSLRAGVDCLKRERFWCEIKTSSILTSQFTHSKRESTLIACVRFSIADGGGFIYDMMVCQSVIYLEMCKRKYMEDAFFCGNAHHVRFYWKVFIRKRFRLESWSIG